MPPFFITLVFLMLRVAVRLGCLKRNSLILRKKIQSQHEGVHICTCGDRSSIRVPPETSRALTSVGCSLACWTNPISNLHFSSGAFLLLSSFQESLLQTKTKSHYQTVHNYDRQKVSPAKQIFCSASKTIHKTTFEAQFSQLFAYHLHPLHITCIELFRS